MKSLLIIVSLFLLASCAELSLTRRIASEPAEVVVAESFNESQMSNVQKAPKGFQLASCSLRTVRKNFKRTLPKKALAMVFIYSNGKGETWTSPYHYVAYLKSDKTLVMLDEEGREITSKYLSQKGGALKNNYYPETREVYFEDPKDINSIKYYRSFLNQKANISQRNKEKNLSECRF